MRSSFDKPRDTPRLQFRWWRAEDDPLAQALWGDLRVAALITAGGRFSPDEVRARLSRELEHAGRFGVQYWPLFERATGAFVGACGLKPRPDDPAALELGFQLCPSHWGRGFAREAAGAVISHAFDALGARSLFAGHHPDNERSRRTLERLGFSYLRHEIYPPTGLHHPLYRLEHALLGGIPSSREPS